MVTHIFPQMMFFLSWRFRAKVLWHLAIGKDVARCRHFYTCLAAASHVVQEVSLHGIDDDDMR